MTEDYNNIFEFEIDEKISSFLTKKPFNSDDNEQSHCGFDQFEFQEPQSKSEINFTPQFTDDHSPIIQEQLSDTASYMSILKLLQPISQSFDYTNGTHTEKTKKVRCAWGQGKTKQCQYKNIFKNFGNMMLKYFRTNENFQQKIHDYYQQDFLQFYKWLKNDAKLETKKNFYNSLVIGYADEDIIRDYKKFLQKLMILFLDEYAVTFIQKSRMYSKDTHISHIPILKMCVVDNEQFQKYNYYAQGIFPNIEKQNNQEKRQDMIMDDIFK